MVRRRLLLLESGNRLLLILSTRRQDDGRAGPQPHLGRGPGLAFFSFQEAEC
jgi:hypothetical protein